LQADRYDVAVIKLDRKVNYLPHIRPICLPDRGAEFQGMYGWVTGWGALEPGTVMSKSSVHLRTHRIKIEWNH
jgi:hypothetical protein